MMKRFLFLALVAALTLYSCEKTAIDEFRGSYSFRTGGYVTIGGEVRSFGDSTKRDTSFVRNVLSESGQMHIVQSGDSTVKLTMNINGGAPVVFDGVVKDDEITLSEIERKVFVVPDNVLTDEQIACIFKVRGRGNRYENTVVLDLEYSGNYRHLYIDGKVTKSDVKCVATKNE